MSETDVPGVGEPEVTFPPMEEPPADDTPPWTEPPVEVTPPAEIPFQPDMKEDRHAFIDA